MKHHPLADRIDETKLVIFAKSAIRENNDNLEDDPDSIDIELAFAVAPDKLGIRVVLSDESSKGKVKADAATVFHWTDTVSRDDDLAGFVEQIGIPQALSASSALFVDIGRSVGAEMPFYGYSAQAEVIRQFRDRAPNLANKLPE